MNDSFCGWYFRCQSDAQTIAMIPAIHKSKGLCSGPIQIISETGNFHLFIHDKKIVLKKNNPYASFGDNLFCQDGIRINLETDSFSAFGRLSFDSLSPIRYDIMGPFFIVPFMECRHSIFSMRHVVNGRICINGTNYDFVNAKGYIEGDRGCSFPKHYAWTQCFFEGGSLMLSVAEIPLGSVHFTGIISIIRLHEKEYRLATYLGAHADKIQNGQIIIRQGSLTFCAMLLENMSYPLHAPSCGAMTRTIHENVSCRARYHLSRKGKTILSFETAKAAFEYEY